MATYNHSVSLNPEKCCGCTHCLKHCPTEAIRIRDRRAVIDTTRCIDCGECIRVCPHQAKKAVYDKLSDIPKDAFKIALPAPALFGQFDNLDDIDYVLQGLLDMGFDEVFEVARAAEIVSGYTRRYLRRPDAVKPAISSACPAVSRLIEQRFPSLIENVIPMLPPVDVAARMAREKALAEHPELGYREVLRMSSEMMDGQKWNTFVLDLSFIGWEILSVFTCGILSIFWVNPYVYATQAELYLELSMDDHTADPYGAPYADYTA